MYYRIRIVRKKTDEFGLVITGMTMPNLTGDMFVIGVVAIRTDIPVVLCTGYSNKMPDAMAI